MAIFGAGRPRFGDPVRELSGGPSQPRFIINHTVDRAAGDGQIRIGFFERAIEALLTTHPTVRAVVRGARVESEYSPYPCVLVSGVADPDGAVGEGVSRRLSNRFAEWAESIRVEMMRRDSPNAHRMRLFIGAGVYWPESHQSTVAVLEFTGSQEAVTAAPDSPMRGAIQRPTLADRDARDACWYQGQPALAVSFNPDLAPARLDASRMGFPEERLGPLGELCLCFGRLDASDMSRVEALSSSDQGASYDRVKCVLADEETLGAWHEADGVWRQLDIELADRRTTRLWFRFTNKTGASRFRPFRPGATAPPLPLLNIVGLLVPHAPIWPWSKPSRWWVEFSSDGALRHSEPMLHYATFIGATLRRYALFRHIEKRWSGSSFSDRGEIRIPLTDALSLELRKLSLRQNFSEPGGRSATDRAKPPVAAKLHRFYGGDPSVLELRGDVPFGHMRVPAEFGQWIPITTLPVLPFFCGGPDEGQMSLEWLNRAGSVEMGRLVGLAEYWCQQSRISVSPSPDRLDVHITDESGGGAVDYAIAHGETRPLGPLLVEYRGTSEGIA